MSQPRRILHLIDELKTGGAQTHLRTVLGQWLKDKSYQHGVISLFGDGEIGDSLRAMGVEVKALDLSSDVIARRWWRAQNAVAAEIRRFNPDLVEAHLTYSRLLGLFAAARAGVKNRFAFEHGDIYFTSMPWRALNFAGQGLARKTIAVSGAMADWLAKTHGFSRRRIEILHNCVDPSVFRPSSQPRISRGQLNIPSDAFVFCAVGTLGGGVNKRTDICIRAFAEFAQHNSGSALLICGDGPQRPGLEALAGELGVGEKVKFLGLRRDVPDVMSMADAFCHAAPFEPFGLVCIEAMLMGLPVIVPDAGGIREIVAEGETGLKYQVLEWPDLSRRMRELASDREIGWRIGEAGRNYVLRNLTVDRYLDKLKAIYGV